MKSLINLIMNYKLKINIVTILTASFPILCLAYGKGYNLPPILLLITALLFIKEAKNIQYTRDTKLVIFSFLFYFSVHVFSLLIHNGKISDIDQPSRIVLAIPIFLLLLRYPPKFNWLINSMVIGSYISGLSAIICSYYYHQNRAFTNDNTIFFLKGFMPIQSGNMAMTLGIISLVITIYHLKNREHLLFIISLFGSIFGIFASILSGSRGGWIFTPIAIIYMIISNRKYINKKIAISFSVLIILFSVSIINTSIFKEKYNQTINNLVQFNKGDSNTSLGIRFELWKSAIYTIPYNPIIGSGFEKRTELTTQFMKQGKVNLPISFANWHSHNQYLEALSVRGIIGFLGLIGILLMPLFIFRNNKDNDSHQLSLINQCGIVSIIMMIGYCLSQVMLGHNSGIIFYSIITSTLLAQSINLYQKVIK